MIRVHLSAGLRSWTGGEAWVEVEAGTVRRLIRELDSRFPGLGEQLQDGMSVAINGDIVADALFEELPDGAEVHFLPAISGG